MGIEKERDHMPDNQIEILKQKLADLQVKAKLKAVQKAIQKAKPKRARIEASKKDLNKLMTKLTKLEKKKKTTVMPSIPFQVSLEKLNKNIETLFQFLSSHEDAGKEKDILQRLDQLLNQNEKIAQGILALADLIRKPEADDLLAEAKRPLEEPAPRQESQFQDQFSQGYPQPPSLDIPPPSSFDIRQQGSQDNFELPKPSGLFDTPESGKSRLFAPPPDDSIKPMQPADSWQPPNMPPPPSPNSDRFQQQQGFGSADMFSPQAAFRPDAPPRPRQDGSLFPQSMFNVPRPDAPRPASPPDQFRQGFSPQPDQFKQSNQPPSDQFRPIQGFSQPQPPGRLKLRPFDNDQK